MTLKISKSYYKNAEEIKKSKFICQLARVETEEEARTFIAQIKSENPKANHNCWTYTLGERQEIQRMSDDGEPSGTAGVPMLEILKKREITDVVAVVTRYFGGIKLGAGGLIRAYAGAVAHALDTVGLVELVEQQGFLLQLDYSLYDSLRRYLQEQGLQMSEPQFTSDVQLSCFVNLDEAEAFLLNLKEQFNDKIAATKTEIRPIEVPYLQNRKEEL